MKVNLYYRSVLKRRNVIKDALLNFFFSFCSYPRLLLEVFIKENFGERYFSFSSALIMSFVLFYMPFPLYIWFADLFRSDYGFEWSKFFLHFLSWYLFLGAFLFLCIKNRRQIKRTPSVFDLARYSRSEGQPNALYLQFLRKGISYDPRIQKTLIEPASFFAVGWVLLLFGQWVGSVLIVASIFYALGYWAAYRDGDNFVMDKIDEMILNEEMENAFILDEPPSDTRGVQFHMHKPNGEELRRKVMNTFLEEDDEDISVAH